MHVGVSIPALLVWAAGVGAPSRRSDCAGLTGGAPLVCRRSAHNPVLSPAVLDAAGVAVTEAERGNFQGPSALELPEWTPRSTLEAVARNGSRVPPVLLYFASHDGLKIRVAAGEPMGPFSPVGVVLRGAEAGFTDHMASPHVVAVSATRRFFLLVHGGGGICGHCSRLAASTDGLHFTVQPGWIEGVYLRMFHYGGSWMLAGWEGAYRGRQGGGVALRRIRAGHQELEPRFDGDLAPGPFLAAPGGAALTEIGRHFSVIRHGPATLGVYYTRIGDKPERVRRFEVDLRTINDGWSADAIIDGTASAEVIAPQELYEGSSAPLRASRTSRAAPGEHALRDPYPFAPAGSDQLFLFYTGGGEDNICVAQLRTDGRPLHPIGDAPSGTGGDVPPPRPASGLPCADLGWPLRGGQRSVCSASVLSPGGCIDQVTAASASAACDAIGSRLCTVAELEADVAAGSGCMFDLQRVWARDDSCGPGSAGSTAGSTKSVHRRACLELGETAAVRCCADAGAAPNPPTPPPPATLGTPSPTTAVLPSCWQPGWHRRHPDVCARSSIGCITADAAALAADECSRLDARLCTVAELEAGAAAGSGCMFDLRWVWTSTVCTVGDKAGVFITAGAPLSAAARPRRCMTYGDGEQHGVRCCRSAN